MGAVYANLSKFEYKDSPLDLLSRCFDNSVVFLLTSISCNKKCQNRNKIKSMPTVEEPLAGK